MATYCFTKIARSDIDRRTMKYALHAALLGTIALAVVGCSTTEVQSPRLSGGSLPSRSSFAFVPHLNQAAAAAVSNAPFWQNRIEASIASVLSQKGYHSSTTRKADLLVAFHIVLRKGEYITIFDNYSGYKLPAAKTASAGIASLAASPNGEAEIGTLVIDIIDPGSKSVIWRGWGRADVNRTAAQTEKLIQTIVSAILRNFPNRT
jgi:uncharacterized protein DUF4136